MKKSNRKCHTKLKIAIKLNLIMVKICWWDFSTLAFNFLFFKINKLSKFFIYFLIYQQDFKLLKQVLLTLKKYNFSIKLSNKNLYFVLFFLNKHFLELLKTNLCFENFFFSNFVKYERVLLIWFCWRISRFDFFTFPRFFFILFKMLVLKKSSQANLFFRAVKPSQGFFVWPSQAN